LKYFGEGSPGSESYKTDNGLISKYSNTPVDSKITGGRQLNEVIQQRARVINGQNMLDSSTVAHLRVNVNKQKP